MIESGHSIDAASAVERCRPTLEGTLDLRERSSREIGRKAALGRCGIRNFRRVDGKRGQSLGELEIPVNEGS